MTVSPAVGMEPVVLRFSTKSWRTFRILMEGWAPRQNPFGCAQRYQSFHDRMVSGTGECARPSINVSPSYDYAMDDNITAPIMNDILVQALSCDYSKVATVHFANAHDHPYSWLTAQNGGAPIVDYGAFSNWHEMVHADYQAGAEHVYRWYMEMFADLLQKLNDTQDVDGDNMLDTSMVLGISEFSSGRHWNTSLR